MLNLEKPAPICSHRKTYTAGNKEFYGIKFAIFKTPYLVFTLYILHSLYSNRDDSIIELQGIGKKTVEKLRFAGFTPELIAVTSPSIIARNANIIEEQASKIADYIRSELLKEDAFITAKDYYEYRKNIEIITTGCNNLNSYLEIKEGSKLRHYILTLKVPLGLKAYCRFIRPESMYEHI